MASKIKEIKNRIIGEVLSETELENIMLEYRYHVILDEDSDLTIKFTNYSSQLWIDVERDTENNILILRTRYVTKEKDVSTEVDPFHSFEDLNKILGVFIEEKKYHHWLCACLMTSLGRRIGDTIALKWSDLYTVKGTFRARLVTLKEEKTGKMLAPRLHKFAQECIIEYCNAVNIKPLEHYNEKIFSTGTATFRAAVSKAIEKIGGFDYPVSTHSFRKFYGSTIHDMHPQDVESIKIVQFIFGHSNEEITKKYIGSINKKIDKYAEDYSEYLQNCKEGKAFTIDNSPVIVLKTPDLREILRQAYLAGKENTNGEEDIEVMNQLLKKVEEVRVS